MAHRCEVWPDTGRASGRNPVGSTGERGLYGLKFFPDVADTILYQVSGVSAPEARPSQSPP